MSLTKKLTRSKGKISLALILALTMFALPLSAVSAADGEVGSIQASAQIFHVSGSPISVNMFAMTPGADYQLNWTGEATGISFTLSATQTKFSHTFVLTSSSSQVTFTLRFGSAGTAIDSVQVTIVNLTDFLSTGLIISAGIFILIIVIFKKVAKG
jgi:hypothetical protein